MTGISVSDIDSDDLFVTIKALDNSGTIKADASDGAVLQTALDGSSMEISGKSGAVNAVLSTLQFKGSPNKSSGQLEITVDDSDTYTNNEIQKLDISINPSPPIITAPTYKLDVKAAKSSNISGLKISDIDSQEVEVTLKGEKGTINGASTSIFILENNFEVGDKITMSNSSTPFTVQSGKTSIDDLLISLKDFLNQDTTFFTINKLTAVRLGSGEIAFVGNGAENITATKTAGSSNGAITKKTVNSTKDAFSLKYPDVIMTGLGKCFCFSQGFIGRNKCYLRRIDL